MSNESSGLKEAVEKFVAEPQPPKALRGLVKKARGRAKALLVCTDPKAELAKLVKQHKACQQAATSIENSIRDRVARNDYDGHSGKWKKGDALPSNIPVDIRVEAQGMADAYRRRAELLERDMMKVLRQIPIFVHFLDKVKGCGPVISAYLVAEIDFTRCTKPSSLRQFCGLGVDPRTNRLFRRTRGERNSYNAELRTRLFQMFVSMRKNGARYGSTKYLEIWDNYKHRMQHSRRPDLRKNVTSVDENARPPELATAFDSNATLLDREKVLDANTKGDERTFLKGNKWIDSTGWHKAADVFLEDLYVVGRAIEGLPVWPNYYAAKLGYAHGGKICVNAPRMLTLADALELVGFVGWIERPVAAE